MPAYGSSKGVVIRNEGLRVVVTLIPPLIIEKCQRSHHRLVLAVTCNLFTFNDLDGLDLPPNFEYSSGKRQSMRTLALANLKGMRNRDVKLSPLMLKLVRPTARRKGELEGEEAASPAFWRTRSRGSKEQP